MAYGSMGEFIDEETYRVLKLLNPESFESHKMLFGFGIYLDEFRMELEPEYIFIGFNESQSMSDFSSFLMRELHIAPVLISKTQCHIPYSIVSDTPWMKELPGYIAHFFYKRYV